MFFFTVIVKPTFSVNIPFTAIITFCPRKTICAKNERPTVLGGFR